MAEGFIRLVTNDRPPLKRAELQQLGDKLASQARVAAIDAVRSSMHSEFLEKGKTLSVADIRRWRGRARAALAAWRLVESLTTELLNELDRAVTPTEEKN